MFIRLFNSICCCCRRGRGKVNKEDLALSMLNKWKIDMYANNRHLYCIPIEREQQKYREILNELKS